jgi:hypothetical protein
LPAMTTGGVQTERFPRVFAEDPALRFLSGPPLLLGVRSNLKKSLSFFSLWGAGGGDPYDKYSEYSEYSEYIEYSRGYTEYSEYSEYTGG